MTREEKILMAIDKGYTCNPITGEVFDKEYKLMTGKINGYIFISVYDEEKRHQLRAHQFIYYCVNKKVVDCIDHINGVKYDNRINNLRSVTRQENAFNTKSKGCTWNKKYKKWVSRIHLDGKSKYIGSFDNEEDASQAYQDAKKKYHQIN